MSETTDKKDQVRVHVIFDADEVQAIDDYSFKARIRTRSEAIRSLIKRGLEADQTSSMEADMQAAYAEIAKIYGWEGKKLTTLGEAIRRGEVKVMSLAELERYEGEAFKTGFPKVTDKAKV